MKGYIWIDPVLIHPKAIQIMKSSLLISCALLSLTMTSIAQAANPDHVKQLLQTKSCPGCDLERADLSGKDLQGADLSGAKMSSVNLSRTNLTNADLTDAYLFNANFTSAYLKSFSMSGSKTTPNTNFQNANMCEETTMPDGSIGAAKSCMAP
jgi:uncharacterized protein YjbI with pentapeptide repeats